MDFDDKTEYALFTGIEQEGFVHKGAHTLFVVGDAPLDLIRKHIKASIVSHVYFGAGGTFRYNPATIKAIFTDCHTGRGITIESPTYNATLHCAIWRSSWVIPYVWQGTLLREGLHSLEMISKGGYNTEYIFGKVDVANKVIVHTMHNLAINDYNYSKDYLLEIKGR